MSKSDNPYISSEIGPKSVNDLSFNESSTEVVVPDLNESNYDMNDPDSLKSYFAQLQKNAELLKQQEKSLKQKYSETKVELAGHDDNAKNAVLQVETVGMMTKYQLVFVKMETAFSKIFNSNRLRDQRKAQSAFDVMRKNAFHKRIRLGCEPRVILNKLRFKLGPLVKTYEKNERII